MSIQNNQFCSPVSFSGRVPYRRSRNALPVTARASIFLGDLRAIQDEVSIDNVRNNRKQFYDSTRRVILGNADDLAFARQEADKERNLYANNPALPNDERLQRQLAKAEIRLSEIELAQERPAADHLSSKNRLQQAVEKLQELYGKKYPLSPALVQGYATLGTYTFDHDVFETTKAIWGDAKMAEEERTFEGMGVAPATSNRLRRTQRSSVEDDLQYLDQAIILSPHMKGSKFNQTLAEAEYRTRKGEVHHGLAHLYASTEEKWDEHTQSAREAFRDALKLLNNIRGNVMENLPPEAKLMGEYLRKKLMEEKAPHLCDRESHHTERTYPQEARDVCGAFSRQGVSFRAVPFEI